MDGFQAAKNKPLAEEYNDLRIQKSKLFAIPILGYVLHFVDALFRLPRNDDRIKELRLSVMTLKLEQSKEQAERGAPRVPADTISRVYRQLLGREPEDGASQEGVSPLDICLAVAISDERKLLVTDEVLRDLAKKNELQVTKTDLGYIVTHADDLAIGRALRDHGVADETDIAVALDLIAENSGPIEKNAFLDVGANIGTHGLHALKVGFTKVISIEPDATNFKLLRANQILNGLDEQCINLFAAASDREDMGLLELSHDNFGDHRIRGANSDAVEDLYDEDTRSVGQTRLARIDTLLTESGVPAKELGLVWMDTQGHEGHALSGSGSLKLAKVPIVIEFWPYGLERSGGYQQLRQFLSEGVQLYDIRQVKNSGDKTPLGLDDLDRLYDQMLVSEERHSAAHTDILILFDT